MHTAKLFKNGRSQAVRLPKECRFRGTQVYVRKYQDAVMLFPTESPWAPLIDSLDGFTPDYMAERSEPEQETRDAL